MALGPRPRRPAPARRGASPPTSGATRSRTASAEFRDRLDGAAAAAAAAGRCCGWRRPRRSLVAALAGYDAWGFQQRPGLRARPNPAPAVARRWAELLAWHPSLPLFWPVAGAGRPGPKQAEWTVKAAEVQVANGTAAPDLADAAGQPEGPGAPARPGDPQGRAGAGAGPARRALEGGPGRGPLARRTDDPEKPLAALDAFLREFPDTPAPRRGPRPGRSRSRPQVGRPAVARSSGSSSTTWSAPRRCPTPTAAT